MSRLRKTRPLRKFARFRNLPTELRLMVWELLRPSQRLVQISNFDSMWKGVDYTNPPRTVFSRFQVPILMHINKEAKGVAEKWYIKVLQLQIGHYIYIDMSRDKLLLESPEVRMDLYGYSLGTSVDNIHNRYDMSVFHENLKHLVLGRLWDVGRLAMHMYKLSETFHTFKVLETVTDVTYPQSEWSKFFNEDWKRFWGGSQMPQLVLKAENLLISELEVSKTAWRIKRRRASQFNSILISYI